MPPRRAPHWFLPLLLSGVALALAPTFRNGFVYDDTQLIVQGSFIHDPHNLPELLGKPSMVAFNIYAGKTNPVDTFRPLTIASFMLDAALAGRSPWAYHLTNLLLHLACVALVFAFASALLGEGSRAVTYGVAAWFGIAPLQSEAYVWISGRYDVLSSALALGAILTWRASIATTSSLRGRALSASVSVLFLLALLSKEVPLLTLPALWLWPQDDARARPLLAKLWRRARALWPFAISTAVYLAMRLHALQGLHTHRDQRQLWLALTHLPVLLLDGLLQALAPSKTYLRVLSEEYARLGNAEIALAGVGVVLLALLAVLARRRFPLLSWGLLWFACLLAPACVVTTLHWPGFGRYLYLASAGLLVGVGSVVADLWERGTRLRWLARLCGIAYFALLLLTLERFIATYRSSEILFRNVIVERPDLGHGYGLLAAYHATELQNLPAVAELYQKACERSPEKFEYAKGLADTLFLLGRREDMVRVAQDAEKRQGLNPEWELIQARGLIERDERRALGHLVRCLQLAPGEPRCVAAISGLLQDPARGPRCRELLTKILAGIGRDPRLAQVRELLTR